MKKRRQRVVVTEGSASGRHDGGEPAAAPINNPIGKKRRHIATATSAEAPTQLAVRPRKGATTKNQRRAAKAAAAATAAGAHTGIRGEDQLLVVEEPSIFPEQQLSWEGNFDRAIARRQEWKQGRAQVQLEAEEVEEEDEKAVDEAEKTKQKRIRKTEDHFGPPVGVKTMINDEWQTCLSSWEAMVPILAPRYRQKRIWQPFFYDGECCKHLRSLGFERVVHSREDFFQKIQDKKFMEAVDFIWDNPPYTNQEIKERVLRACEASGKPFCLLLPLSVLHSQFLRDVLDITKVQSVIPRKVYVKKRNQDPLPFKYLVWLCYKTGLDKDLYLL